MRVLAFLVGVILLLPGACSLGFMVMSIGDSSLGPIPLLWFVCFLISAGGVVLIRKALRKPMPPRDPPA